jgi:repressor LexA
LTVAYAGAIIISQAGQIAPLKQGGDNMRPWKQEHFDSIERCINEYSEEYGDMPTIREIEKRTGIPNSTVSRYLRHMNEQGIISYSGKGKISTIAVEKTTRSPRRTPIVGTIACGTPMLAEQNIEEYVKLPETWTGQSDCFILHAHGDSMINVGINDGDLVVIRQQPDAEPGQIIAARVGDEATLKRYRPVPEKHCVELVPENDALSPQTIDLTCQDFSVQGIAVMVIKRLQNEAIFRG